MCLGASDASFFVFVIVAANVLFKLFDYFRHAGAHGYKFVADLFAISFPTYVEVGVQLAECCVKIVEGRLQGVGGFLDFFELFLGDWHNSLLC